MNAASAPDTFNNQKASARFLLAALWRLCMGGFGLPVSYDWSTTLCTVASLLYVRVYPQWSECNLLLGIRHMISLAELSANRLLDELET